MNQFKWQIIICRQQNHQLPIQFETADRHTLFPISKVIERIKENSELIDEYEKQATDLLEWIQVTIVKLSDRTFANNLVGVQQQMLEFNQYRTQEKPPRY